MIDAVLALKGVSKTYQGFRLGPVNVEIESGYLIAVVGPNGSGKSTLFRMLMDLVHPDDGEIRVFGQPNGDEIEMNARIGYVPERSTSHDQMSVEDLGVFYARWYPRFDRQRYETAVTAMEIELGKSFKTLSKGMQRRVSFALAMASDPELLLLDELTDGVDPFARREMVADLARFMEPGDRTVVFATHNMDEVRRLADYVVFLVDGVFLGMYEKDTLLDDWRRVRLKHMPAWDTPGVVRVSDGHPVEMISNAWSETIDALRLQGIVVERSAPMELTDILEHLITGAQMTQAGEVTHSVKAS